MTRRSKARVWIGFAAGLAVACFGLGAFALRHLQARAPSELARVLGDATGLRARVGGAKLDLRAGTLTASGIVLERDDGTTALEARSLRARLSRSAMLRGRFVARSLELDAVALRLRASDLGRLSARATRSELETLVLMRGRARVELEALGALELHWSALQAAKDGARLRFSSRDLNAKLLRDGAELAHAHVGFADDARAGTAKPIRLVLDGIALAARSIATPIELGLQLETERLIADGRVRLPADAGAIMFSASLPLHSAAPATLRLAPRALSLVRALPSLAAEAPASGATLDGVLELEGTLAPFSMRGPFQGELDGIAVKGSVRAEADGELTAELDAEALDLARLGAIGGLPLAGRGRGGLRAHGSWDAPELEVTLALEGAALGEVELGKLDTKFAVRDGGRTLVFEHATLDSAARKLRVNELRLRFEHGLAQANARVQIAELQLSELYRVLGAGDDARLSRLQANARGDAQVSYTRDARGPQLELGLRLELAQASLDDYRFERGALRARIALPVLARGFEHGSIVLEQLRLEAGAGLLELTGALEHGEPTLALAFQRLRLGQLPWLHARMPALDARVAGKGTLSAAAGRAELVLTLDELRLREHALGQLTLHAALRRKDATGPLEPGCEQAQAALATGALEREAWLICGDGLGRALHVDVALSADEQRRVRGRVTLGRYELAAFLPEREHGRMRGHLIAALELTGGGLAQPERLSGRLEVKELALGEGDAAVASSAPFTITLRDGALALNAATLEGPNQKFTLSAAGTLAARPRLIADGSVAASLLSHASQPLVQVFGDVGVHLEWSPSERPELRAQAELKDLSVRIESFARVHDLRGKLELSGERVKLAGLSAELGNGTLVLDGELALAGTRVVRYELGLHAEHVALEPQPKLTLELDTDSKLVWTGPGAVPALSGRVKIWSLLYARHIQLPEALTALNQKDRADKAGYAPARDRVRFEFELEHEQPLRVHNNFLDGELSVAGPERKLRVIGSDQRFGLLGQLELTRGRVLYRGDSFVVKRGRISFDDKERVAPTFDLRAVADTKRRPDASVVLSANGTRDSFELKVACEAGGGGPVPPAFSCRYAHEDLRCDRFEQLVQLWLCQPKTALSRADDPP